MPYFSNVIKFLGFYKNLKKEVFMLSRKALFFLLLIGALSFAAYSQIIQTGTLTGNVIDKEGGALPGVTVIIKSPALMNPHLSTVTNEKGYFRFPVLPPGLYTVTYELSGFKTFVHEGVRISLGGTVALNDETLEVSPIKETVVVTGKAPIVDVQKTTLTANYQKEFLESIPTQRALLISFFSLVPGVSNETYHGAAISDNAFMLDGVNVSDPQSGGILVSYGFDIMEELSVDTGALQAEYGNVRGAVINTVTKSGGNEIHGEASFYNRSKSLQAVNTKGTPLEGQYVGFIYENDATFNLGGPIIKDKLWFFGNLNFQWTESYVNGYTWENPGKVPTDLQRNYPYVKLSWQINDTNKLVFSFSHGNIKRKHRNASMYRDENTTWIQNDPFGVINLQWTKFFGSNLFINVKTAYCPHLLAFYAKNDKIGLYDSVTRFYSQNYGYDNISRRSKFEIEADATKFVDEWMGGHEFKTGLFMQFSRPSFQLKTYKDPRYGLGYLIYLKSGVPDYILNNEDYTQRAQNLMIGGFIQDSWSPTKRLTLNIGFRYDYQEGVIPEQGEDRTPIVYGGKTYDLSVKKAFKALVWNSVSPRFGLAYALTGDGKTVLKASYGRYYEPAISQWFNGVNPNGAVSWRQGLNPDWTLKGDPYLFSAASEGKIDPNLKIPYIDEFTVGIEREIMMNTKLGLKYIRKMDRNTIEDVDMNSLDMNALNNGKLVWTNYTAYSVSDPFNNENAIFYGVTNTALTFASYITNPPGAKRDYNAVEITIQKKYSNRWQLFASYVYAHSRGIIDLNSGSSTGIYNNPNSLINAFGLDQVVAPHQFKLQGSWSGPWGINVSGYFLYLAGQPYTRTIRSSDLGLNLSQGSVTLFAEEKGSRRLPDQKELDMRVEKTFNLPGKFGQLELIVDIFNLFNANTAITQETVSSNPALFIFGNTTGIMAPRILRLGIRLMF